MLSSFNIKDRLPSVWESSLKYKQLFQLLVVFCIMSLTSQLCPAIKIERLEGVPDKSCGLLSLSYCFYLLEVGINVDDLIAENTAHEYGFSLLELSELAHANTCYTIALNINAHDLLNVVSKKQPAIIHSAKLEHFFATTGFDQSNGKIKIMDPAYLAHFGLSLKEFKEIYNNKALIISKTPIKLTKPENLFTRLFNIAILISIGSLVLIVFSKFFTKIRKFLEYDFNEK